MDRVNVEKYIDEFEKEIKRQKIEERKEAERRHPTKIPFIIDGKHWTPDASRQ